MVRITSCSSKVKKCQAEQRDKTQKRETNSIQKRRLPTTVCLGYTTMTANRNKYQNNSKKQTRRRKKKKTNFPSTFRRNRTCYIQTRTTIYIYMYYCYRLFLVLFACLAWVEVNLYLFGVVVDNIIQQMFV